MLRTQPHLSRRKLLTACTSALGGIGAGLLAVPFIASWFPSRKAQAVGAPVKVDVSKLTPGELYTIIWRQQPVLVFRRTKAALKILASSRAPLADPNSNSSEQPDYAKNATRSIQPDVGVFLANCTHLGCIPIYKPDPGQVEEFGGSFFCPCHGSKFDLAGRVYASMPAPTNLKVPPYKFADANTIIIGEDTQKAAS